MFGSVLDITDNFESLNSFVIIGDTKTEAILEKFVGFLGGFVFLAVGLFKWIPGVQGLSDLVDLRTRDIQEINKSLVSESTDRKRAELAYRNSEFRIRAILDTVNDGIITFDAKGTIETFNPAAVQIFGYAVSEAIGKNVNCLMPEPYHSEHDGYLRNNHDSDEAKITDIARKEVVGQRKDGSTFPMEFAVSEMKVGEAQMLTCTIRDITDSRQAEKLKNEFISTVSHDLRTPLTSIKGSLGLISSGTIGELPEKIVSMFEIAYTNSDRLECLINDILDSEKISSGKMDFRMTCLDLKPLLEQAIESTKALWIFFRFLHRIDYFINSVRAEAIQNPLPVPRSRTEALEKRVEYLEKQLEAVLRNI